MKQRILLIVLTAFTVSHLNAQKKEQKVSGFAVTGSGKGNQSWKEVRLIDMKTGEEIKSIYSSSTELQALNARTGKPISKKDADLSRPQRFVNGKRVVSLDDELATGQIILMEKSVAEKSPDKQNLLSLPSTTGDKKVIVYHATGFSKVSTDKPFATNSAAMAYDKKHNRLYYTPMNINQLRYIDLSGKSPAVYYFEDEAFGTMKPGTDIGKQITRMVIASDGNGYALTNDAKNLIRFTTGKNAAITELGTLSDDAANGKNSVHNRSGYGGDLVADGKMNLYLVTSNRNVFKISIETRVATFLGTIKGLPTGFQTNGAMVESGARVIVCSSQSTEGYYRFDLTTLEAEKMSTGGAVFNASDLANGNLAFEKSKKEKKEKAEPVAEKKEVVITEPANKKNELATLQQGSDGINVYPNPVTDGLVKLAFTNQPAGLYQVQLLDLSGRVMSNQQVNVSARSQVVEIRLPQLLGAGTYYVKVTSEINKVSSVNKLVVQ